MNLKDWENLPEEKKKEIWAGFMHTTTIKHSIAFEMNLDEVEEYFRLRLHTDLKDCIAPALSSSDAFQDSLNSILEEISGVIEYLRNPERRSTTTKQE